MQGRIVRCIVCRVKDFSHHPGEETAKMLTVIKSLLPISKSIYYQQKMKKNIT